MMNPDCYFGDHDWAGSGVCGGCGERLRCACGRFMRADALDAHADECPWVLAHLEADELQLVTNLNPNVTLRPV